MVREAVIVPTELKRVEGSPGQRDLLLTERLGLHPEDLAPLRNGKYLDRIISATKELSQRGLDTEIKQHTLAAIVFEEWDNYDAAIRKVGTAIARKYKEQRKSLEQETGLNITNIHLLREEFGNYSGNLIDAKRVWPNFQTGHCDWLRSVKIPLNIDSDVAMLIGFYWADGLIFNKEGRQWLRLDGSSNDFEFYESVVAPLVEQVHHIAQGVTTETVESYMNGKKFSRNHPLFNIGSMAIATWAREDLGLSENRKNMNLPLINLNGDLKKDFLSGIIAGKGSINKRNEMYINDTDPVFIESIYQLFRECGYTPRINKRKIRECTNYQIGISPRDLRVLAEEDLLIHPNKAYSPPSIDSRKAEYRKNQILDLIKEYEEHKSEGLKALEISKKLGMDKRAIFRYLAEMKMEKRLCLKNHIYYSTK